VPAGAEGISRMDVLLRVLFFIVAGGLLLLVNLWIVHAVRQVFYAPDLLIAPIQVVGPKVEDARLGQVLPDLLQTQLTAIRDGLQRDHRWLVGEGLPGDLPPPEAPERLTGLYSAPATVRLNWPLFAGLDELPAMKIAVAGVEISGVFPWLQRQLTSHRTLVFKVYLEGDTAIISGNIAPLTGRAGASLRIKAPASLAAIADRLAYALVQSILETHPRSKVRDLELEEFEALLTTLSSLASLNRRAQGGRTVESAEFASLLRTIEPLVARLPQWHELTYLAAEIADRAEQDAKALAWYEQLLAPDKPEGPGQPIPMELRTRITARVNALRPAIDTVVTRRQQAFLSAAKRYAERRHLPEPEPAMAFVTPHTPGLIAVWNDALQRYEINTERMETPGLPEYVALMGRFMAKHYRRCFGDSRGASAIIPLWNEFRIGLTRYVLSLEPDLEEKALPYGATKASPLEAVLRRIETELPDGPERVRQLALALLDRFECSWTPQSLPRHVQAINEELQLVPQDVLARAFAADGRP
jgi:hypothetical protein